MRRAKEQKTKQEREKEAKEEKEERMKKRSAAAVILVAVTSDDEFMAIRQAFGPLIEIMNLGKKRDGNEDMVRPLNIFRHK